MVLIDCSEEAREACPYGASCSGHNFAPDSECARYNLTAKPEPKRETVRDKGTVYDFVTVDMDTDYALQNALGAINDGGYKIVTSWLDSQNGFAVVIFERPAHG